MNELNKLYKAMLLSWGGVIKDNGRIMMGVDGAEFPIRIDDMELYLPLSEVLDGNCVDKVFFHPACENITSKETEVFKIIRNMTIMKLLDTFRKFPMVLIGVAGGAGKKGWKQDTFDLIEPLKGVKRATRDELNKLFTRMHVEVDEDGLDNRFVHFKISKGGGRSKLTGERVYYKTKPVFPFYSEIIKRLARSEGQSDNQNVEINNFTVSRGTLKLAAHLFQSIIPAVNAPDDYEYESTSMVGARLLSYLGCYTEIVEQMNRIQNIFRVDFDKAGVYNINTDWTEHLETLPDIYRQVPVMDYNSHNTQDEEVINRSSMGNLMSVKSNNQQQNNLDQNNNNNQQQQPMGNVNGFDTTPPQMEYGDRWVRSEIDYNNNRVVHYAQGSNGAQVVYHCTRQGNKLQRAESSPNNMMMGNMNMGMMNMGMSGAQMLPNGMVMLPNGQIVHPSQLQQQQQTTTAGGASAVYQPVGDNSSYIGF